MFERYFISKFNRYKSGYSESKVFIPLNLYPPTTNWYNQFLVIFTEIHYAWKSNMNTHTHTVSPSPTVLIQMMACRSYNFLTSKMIPMEYVENFLISVMMTS